VEKGGGEGRSPLDILVAIESPTFGRSREGRMLSRDRFVCLAFKTTLS
jgi:hypothetical protein